LVGYFLLFLGSFDQFRKEKKKKNDRKSGVQKIEGWLPAAGKNSTRSGKRRGGEKIILFC
jgi:hypothetical protein